MDAAWACPACGNRQGGEALVCLACGIARSYHADPPLDLPPAPRLAELPATYLAMLWTALAAGGCLALLLPGVRAALGLPASFLLLETATALLAALSSWGSALWDATFNEMRVELPSTAQTGAEVPVTVTLVPYRTVGGVGVTVELLDRYFERRQGAAAEARSRRLERHRLLTRGRLRGRRAQVMVAELRAPFPDTRHSDVGSELLASLLTPLGWLVPGLSQVARNLREHGGYYVRVTVRAGWLRKTVEKRLLSYWLGHDLFVG